MVPLGHSNSLLGVITLVWYAAKVLHDVTRNYHTRPEVKQSKPSCQAPDKISKLHKKHTKEICIKGTTWDP